MINTLYTNGKQVLRIRAYFPPTPSTEGYFHLERFTEELDVSTTEFFANWKIFNSDLAVADYLLCSAVQLECDRHTNSDAVMHMVKWVMEQMLQVGMSNAIPITEKLRYQLTNEGRMPNINSL